MRRTILLAALLAVTACNEQPPTALSGGPHLALTENAVPRARLFAAADGSIGVYAVNGVDDITLEQVFPYFAVYRRFVFGVGADDRGNLYMSTFAVGDGLRGLDIVDLDLNLIGRVDVDVSIAQPGLNNGAFRAQPEQYVVCNPLRPFARLFVFDVADKTNPTLLNIVNIPFTDLGGGCAGMAFDGSGDLWVTSSGQLIRLTLDAQGIPIAATGFVTSGANPTDVLVEPNTGRLYYSAVNANFVGVAEPTDPGTRVASITSVCDNAVSSPGALEFSDEGDLFVGCANNDGATTDLVVFGAATLVGLSGAVEASSLNGLRIASPGITHGALAFARTFVDPADRLRTLIEQVVALELNRGLETALSATLGAALASLENDRPAAVMQIESFKNQVGAMRGNQLTDAEADDLIDRANDVIDAILSLP